jgi:hypothetical protein
MRTLFASFLLILFAQAQSATAPEAVVRAAVEKQKARPLWFHPFTMLLPEIPYAYQATATLTIQREGDAELRMSAETKHDLVLGEGWQEVRNGEFRTSGSGRDVQTLTGIRGILFERYRQRLAAMDRERLQESNETLRARNAQAWEEFLSALKFERIASRIQNRRATSIFSFAPIRADGSSFYSRIRGQVWIDDMDLEIVHFEYVFEKDSPEFLSFGPVRKKTRYTVDLTKSIDGAWLPVRAGTELFRRNGSEVSQEGYVVEFKGYRKFDVDVKISIPGRQP